jgi:hypothetical protein
MRELIYSSTNLNLGTRCRDLSFTLLPLYPRGNSVQYALYRRLDGPKILPGK